MTQLFQHDTGWPDPIQQIDLFLSAVPAGPRTARGDGVVTSCDGNSLQQTLNAAILFSCIRATGYTGMIQCWCTGPREFSQWWADLAWQNWAAEIVSAQDYGFLGHLQAGPVFKDRVYTPQVMNGFTLKLFAMKETHFQTAIWLDYDSHPVLDIRYFLRAYEYQKHGLILWQDPLDCEYGSNFEAFGLKPTAPTQGTEVGQVVMDRERCWKELSLAYWFCAHGDYWFNHTYGDKDAIWLACLKTGKPYTLCLPPQYRWRQPFHQRRPDGKVAFWHYTGRSKIAPATARAQLRDFPLRSAAIDAVLKWEAATAVIRNSTQGQ